jgi:ferredoxin-like protein FixX
VRKDGLFIAVEVDDAAAADTVLAKKLTDACPVDIYAQHGDGTLELVEKSLDECVLCRLCLDAAAGRDPAPVRVLKLYEDGAAL